MPKLALAEVWSVGYHFVVLPVMSAARRAKSTMKTGSLGWFVFRTTLSELRRVSDLFDVTSRPLLLATLNSGSSGVLNAPVLPRM